MTQHRTKTLTLTFTVSSDFSTRVAAHGVKQDLTRLLDVTPRGNKESEPRCFSCEPIFLSQRENQLCEACTARLVIQGVRGVGEGDFLQQLFDTYNREEGEGLEVIVYEIQRQHSDWKGILVLTGEMVFGQTPTDFDRFEPDWLCLVSPGQVARVHRFLPGLGDPYQEYLTRLLQATNRGMGTTREPLHAHDCRECHLLAGNVFHDEQHVDIYCCVNGVSPGTIVIRHDSFGSAYTSVPIRILKVLCDEPRCSSAIMWVVNTFGLPV
jgi:hypothetical protein